MENAYFLNFILNYLAIVSVKLEASMFACIFLGVRSRKWALLFVIYTCFHFTLKNNWKFTVLTYVIV